MYGTFLVALSVYSWITVSCQLPECTTPRCSCCKDQVCSSSNNTCMNGCIDGIWGNSCYLPCPSICTKCTQQGGACTSCIAGKFGSDCSKDCPANCATCTIDSKEGGCPCLSCKAGFTGDNCNECMDGYYRESDKNFIKCSNFCKNGTCDAVNGYCLNGCLDKYWGVACLNKCPENCLICHRETGICQACDNGKYKSFCSADCNAECASNAQGKKLCKIENGECFIGCRTKTIYGYFCQKLCSKNCVASECDRVTGKCNECEGDKYGSSCQYDCGVNCLQQGESQLRCHAANGSCVHDCPSGYYGYECQYKCSSHCNTPGCSRTYGRCDDGCKKGYIQRGYDCDKDSSNYGDVGQDLAMMMGPIGGIAVICLTVFLVIVLRKWLIKRRKRENSSSGDDTSDTTDNQLNHTNFSTAATGDTTTTDQQRDTTTTDKSRDTTTTDQPRNNTIADQPSNTTNTDQPRDNTTTNQPRVTSTTDQPPPAYEELNELPEQRLGATTTWDQPPPAYEELKELPAQNLIQYNNLNKLGPSRSRGDTEDTINTADKAHPVPMRYTVGGQIGGQIVSQMEGHMGVNMGAEGCLGDMMPLQKDHQQEQFNTEDNHNDDDSESDSWDRDDDDDGDGEQQKGQFNTEDTHNNDESESDSWDRDDDDDGHGEQQQGQFNTEDTHDNDESESDSWDRDDDDNEEEVQQQGQMNTEDNHHNDESESDSWDDDDDDDEDGNRGITRPDQMPDTLGLTVLDEPCSKQSDPEVLGIQLRAISNQLKDNQTDYDDIATGVTGSDYNDIATGVTGSDDFDNLEHIENVSYV